MPRIGPSTYTSFLPEAFPIKPSDLSRVDAGSGGFACLLLRFSLWDSDVANQSLEALILAQGVEYRLDSEVDHQGVAFLKTLLQPFQRALLIADAHTRHSRQ